MSDEWKEYILNELIITNSTTYSEKNDSWDFINYLDTSNITNNTIDKYQYFNSKEDKIPSRAKRKVKNGDVIFSTVRPNQRHFGILKNIPDNCLVSTGFVTIKSNKDDCYLPYIYWFLSDSRTIQYLQNIAENSTSAYPSIKPSVLENLTINLPPLSEQKKIAHILGTLDDKIELNRKMNETLELMAEALFKSWFVDFDPVIDKALKEGKEIPEELSVKAERRKQVLASEKYKPLPKDILDLFPSSFEYSDELDKWIPEGWEVKKLSDLAKVKYGKDHKKLNDGNFPCYGSGGIMRLVDNTLYNKPSVLIPRKGTLSNLIYVRKPFWSVDTMFFTEFENDYLVKFLFFNLLRLDFTEMNVGSAVPSMTTALLNDLNIIFPSDSLLIEFDNTLEKYYLKNEQIKQETENLEKTRDTLLPKLISGKVRV
jgi:type I restriction enzyme S subunit